MQGFDHLGQQQWFPLYQLSRRHIGRFRPAIVRVPVYPLGVKNYADQGRLTVPQTPLVPTGFLISVAESVGIAAPK